MRINIEICNRALARNPILVTALTPEIGYLAAAALAKKAIEQDRTILEVALEETVLPRERLEELLAPRNLARGGGKSGTAG